MKNNTPNLPNSLVEAIRYFADEDRCFEFVKGLRRDQNLGHYLGTIGH